MLIDQDTRVEGVFVRFFGRPTYTASGPVVLSMKLGSQIVPIFMYLRRDLKYHIECAPPLVLQKTADEKLDLVSNVQKCSNTIESMIRRFPAQWVWMHERWKTQPVS
jgi:KDO2-lipid IV(A) lauroyltransferase